MSSKYIKWVVFIVLCVAGAGFWLGGAMRNTGDEPGALPTTADQPTQPIPYSNAQLYLPATGAEQGTAPGSNGNGDLERQTAFLANGQYEQAVEIYSDLYAQLSEVDSIKYRDAIVSFGGGLAVQLDHEAVVSLMGVYTELFYKDLPALRLLADSQHLLKHYPDEIATLHLALNEAYLEEDIFEFNTKLDNAIIAQDLLFVQQNDPDSTVEFYRSLLLDRPESVPLQIGLARAMIKTGAIDEAVAALHALPDTTGYTGQIGRLLEIAEASRPLESTAIPLRRSGKSFIANVIVNDNVAVRLIIDTGATLTIIRPDALRRAGVGPGQYETTRTLVTAGGQIKVPVFRIGSLKLGTEVVSGIAVGGIDIPGLGNIDGLLGMDFLNHFRFTIDQEAQVMLLMR
jgi:clan AA aspartic protease (TIGR02281 family)